MLGHERHGRASVPGVPGYDRTESDGSVIAGHRLTDVDWHSLTSSASKANGRCGEDAVRRSTMALDDRKLEVLRAIVEDYVATQEPVGSKALVERHHLRVSPATVRNDMAVLEDEGY